MEKLFQDSHCFIFRVALRLLMAGIEWVRWIEKETRELKDTAYTFVKLSVPKGGLGVMKAVNRQKQGRRSSPRFNCNTLHSL